MRNYDLEQKIFSNITEDKFENICMEIFEFQYNNCNIYNTYCNLLGKTPTTISHYKSIPFLPISLFKTHSISSYNTHEAIFESSGTTGSTPSKHYIYSTEVYTQSFLANFITQYGNPQDYCILALLPSYLERQHSSLVFMVNYLITKSNNPQSGFFMYNFDDLHSILNLHNNKKIMLFGVTFALLDFAEQYPQNANTNLTIIETGGMKGRKKELTRAEVHTELQTAFPSAAIHSEYGMTELLSQAYSFDSNKFTPAPWMKIFVRDMYDPFTYLENERIGGLNVIDLANLYSCSFIETQDVGRLYSDKTFTVEGRFDNSDIRGCNLLYNK